MVGFYSDPSSNSPDVELWGVSDPLEGRLRSKRVVHELWSGQAKVTAIGQVWYEVRLKFIDHWDNIEALLDFLEEHKDHEIAIDWGDGKKVGYIVEDPSWNREGLKGEVTFTYRYLA